MILSPGIVDVLSSRIWNESLFCATPCNNIQLNTTDPSCRLLKGEDEGKALAEKIAAMPAPGVRFWMTYTKLCTQCLARKANNKVAKKEREAVSRVFEQAVVVHGQDVELWLQWIRFLEEHASGDESVLVTQRAVAALPARAADSLTLQLRET